MRPVAIATALCFISSSLFRFIYFLSCYSHTKTTSTDPMVLVNSRVSEPKTSKEMMIRKIGFSQERSRLRICRKPDPKVFVSSYRSRRFEFGPQQKKKNNS